MKKIKGFTLIELIIVMAIFAILMAAIMRMFTPIRATYVDSTLYEAQRTSQNGVITYVTESVRYATDLGMYTKNKASTVTAAVEKFTDAYLEKNGVTSADPDYAAKRTETLKKVKSLAEVIIIDNTKDAYTFGNEDFTGRILRRQFIKNTAYNPSTSKPYEKNNQLTNDAEKAGTDECRLALGSAYYGKTDYTISLGITQDPTTKEGDANDGIKVTVSSGASHGGSDVEVISNTGLVMCPNLSIVGGMFDTVNFDPANATAEGTKVYIVYLNKHIDITT